MKGATYTANAASATGEVTFKLASRHFAALAAGASISPPGWSAPGRLVYEPTD